MLYHGTAIGGLHIIKANAKSHTTGKQVAYFTQDRCYALVCCRARDENFVTMGPDPEGKQHYFERFPDQLKTLYDGRRGYLYTIASPEGLVNTKGHTWESAVDVPVCQCETVDDVYAEILREEQLGNVVIHRYAEIDPLKQKENANWIKEHLDDYSAEMRKFYLKHLSFLWD